MTDLQDLPVTVALPGVVGSEVVAYVEGEAGWQVVADDGPPPPVLALVAEPVAGRACVVVVDGTPDPVQVRAALLAGALDVIAWPQERGRLLDAPLRVPQAPPQAAPATVLRVAGAAGGAGTSTVALALGGLFAWSGRPAVVVGDDDLLALCGVPAWQGPGAVEVAALGGAHAAAEVATLARPVGGVPGLRVLGGGGVVADGAAAWDAAVVVCDLGSRVDPTAADLVVGRPDGSLRRVRDLAERLVVVGERPLDRPAVRRLLGHAPAAQLPTSARVARAGLAGRVPAGLPGSWLAGLEAALAAARPVRAGSAVAQGAAS